MEPQEARAELRSYAVRRCVRFCTALLLVGLQAGFGSLLWHDAKENHLRVTAVLLALLAAAEALSTALVLGAERAARRDGDGPWLRTFVHGPVPGWVATVLYAGLAAALWLGSTP